MNKREAIQRLEDENWRVAPVQAYAARRMQDEDAWGVARCFFAVYGENYPHDQYYIPEWLIEENRTGNLHSFVVRAENGDIVGHAALFRSSADSPKVYEFGQAIILPEYRRTLALWRLQEYMLKVFVPGEDIDQVFAESVTNHVITQKMGVVTGFRETGIEIGLMPAGAYENPGFPNDRISTVLSFLNVRDRMLSVYVPKEYECVFDLILPGMELARKVIVSEAGIPEGTATELESRFFDFAGVARLAARRTGDDFVEVLTSAEREAEGRGIQVVQVYVNLCEAWSGRVVSALRQKGYFFGGFLPRWFESDGLLMQKLASLPNFDSIKLFSRKAKDILDFIRGDVPG